MYQNDQPHHSHSLLIASPPKYRESLSTRLDDVSSLGQVVKKFNGLIDSNSFLQSDKQSEPKPRSQPIAIPKPGQRAPLLPLESEGESRAVERATAADPCFPPPSLASCCHSPATDVLPPSYSEDSELVCSQIAQQIEAGIKRAKGSTLDCNEVLIPLNLMQQVALDIVSSSEVEPTGLRGCLLYVGLEDPHSKEVRRIGCLRPIGQLANPVPTFELYLTLKQAHSGWLHQVSHKVLKLGRKSLVISDQYQLSKKKLFRSDRLS